MTPQQTLAQAMTQHQSGNLPDAERLYKEVLAADPKNPQCLHLLGVLAHQTGRNEQALKLIRQSIALSPKIPQFHANLGRVLTALHRWEQATESLDEALALGLRDVSVHGNLGDAWRELGRWNKAIDAYKQALAIDPRIAEAHNSLGTALEKSGRTDEAIASYRQALAVKQDYPSALNNLSAAMWKQGGRDQALSGWKRAIELRADFAGAHNNLGNALNDLGRRPEAIAHLRQAVAIEPDHAEFHANLGLALKDNGQLDEAVAALTRAVELNPNHAEAFSALAGALAEQCKLDDAITAGRKAAQLQPKISRMYVNLLFAMFHHPDYDAPKLLSEIKKWASRIGPTSKSPQKSSAGDPTPHRRLRIGYLSPYFRRCADAHFIAPLLSHHDRTQFEIFAYTRTPLNDPVSDLMRRHCDHWHDLNGLPDQAAADLIREHRLDILTIICEPAGNSWPIAAQKPAPVQITWLAFASCTTGLKALDYRLSDPYLDPTESDERSYTERTLRLPHTAWCYDPLLDPVPVAPPPALFVGHVTFGCFHRFSKMNPHALATWARVLHNVPNSRLLMLARPGSHRQTALDHFARAAVSPDRIEFVEPLPPVQFMQLHHRIDVMLDAFPYSGHTTALDSIWMGVPLVAMRGRTAVGRAAASILQNLGFPQWIAANPDEYVIIATDLAGDLPRLNQLRNDLRQKLESSPLMASAAFARHVEQAYRDIAQK
jgi:predicted O-linked N-acetylglucosamine transferase (SPINDLY family)